MKLATEPLHTPTDPLRPPPQFDVHAARRSLEARIQRPIGPGNHKRLESILKGFRTHQHQFSFTVHCEAALAALAKYVDLAIIDSDTQSQNEGEGEDKNSNLKKIIMVSSY
jgi:hypothetical protein